MIAIRFAFHFIRLVNSRQNQTWFNYGEGGNGGRNRDGVCVIEIKV